MSVIMDHSSDKLAEVFFGCPPSDIKKTVILTLGIHWLFGKIAKRKFVVKRSMGWWNLALIKCDDSYATVIAAGCGSSEVTDIVRLLTKFSCERVVGVGIAGALKRDIQIGNIIVPVRAIPAYAKSMNEAVSHSQELYSVYRSLLEDFCIKNGVLLHEGTLCTIDAITSEDSKFYAYAERMNLLGVDMETFHLYREAKKAGFKVSSFHMVSDNPIQHKSFVDDIPKSDIFRKDKIYRKTPTLIKNIAALLNMY
ncbi:MAG: hypothetical protein QXH40_05745 [Candidatus Bathyarchaeia archaeon]